MGGLYLQMRISIISKTLHLQATIPLNVEVLLNSNLVRYFVNFADF
jgi:hypothetical protein